MRELEDPNPRKRFKMDTSTDETQMDVPNDKVDSGLTNKGQSWDGSQDMFDFSQEESNGDIADDSRDPEDTWQGVPLQELNRVGETIGPEYPPPVCSNDHTICVKLPLQRAGPEPYPDRLRDVWDSRHVKMPWSSNSANLVPLLIDGEEKLFSRWKLIKDSLSADLKNFQDIKSAILKYNPRYASSPDWSFLLLESVINSFSPEENDNFYQETLPGMVKLCLSGPEILTSPLPLLTEGQTRSLTLSQVQIAALLANAFFCTFPRRNSQGKRSEYASYPSINFNRLLSASKRRPEAQEEKLKCILAYFSQVTTNPPQGLVTFTRRHLGRHDMPDWSRSRKSATSLHITASGTIETEGKGMLQVDFANKFVGGGVLGSGLVQEEIRFTICPELIVSRLFTEVLDNKEVMIAHGIQQYSTYEGYAETFRFTGRFKDPTGVDITRRRHTTVVAMDATRFSNESTQFQSDMIERELNKAYVGFSSKNIENNKLSAVATGNWGCGAFNGDLQLKFILQIMAAAQAGRDVCYFTFGNKELVKAAFSIHTALRNKKVTVRDLFRIVCDFREVRMVSDREAACDLFQHIYSQIFSSSNDDVYQADTDDSNSSLPNSKETTFQQPLQVDNARATEGNIPENNCLSPSKGEQAKSLKASSDEKTADADPESATSHSRDKNQVQKMNLFVENEKPKPSQTKITSYFKK